MENLGKLLAEIPTMVSNSFYDYMAEKDNRVPRFDSVFKRVKAELKYEGVDFNKLSESDREEIKYMARDTYDGLREAGF